MEKQTVKLEKKGTEEEGESGDNTRLSGKRADEQRGKSELAVSLSSSTAIAQPSSLSSL